MNYSRPHFLPKFLNVMLRLMYKSLGLTTAIFKHLQAQEPSLKMLASLVSFAQNYTKLKLHNHCYFRPGKVCALCNLSERSQLGQGEMRQIPCSIEGEGNTTPIANSGGATPTSVTTPGSAPTTPVTPGLVSPPPELLDPNQHPLALPLSRRQKAFNKCK